jgi:hypothetical protein
MSERFTMWLPAESPGIPLVQWTPEAVREAFAGRTIRVSTGDAACEGTILAAEAAADGSGIYATVEVPDGTLPKQPLSGYSIP